jgi:hypothetical protein
VKALLPLCILLLAGCNLGEQVASGGSATSQPTTESGGGSGSGGTTGGGGGTTPPPPPPGPVVPVNPAGIWAVTGTINGNVVSEVALIAEGKYYALASTDEFGCGDIRGGTYMAAAGVYAGSSFTGSGTALLLDGCSAPVGQTGYVAYTLNGSLMSTSLNLSFDVAGNLLPALGATLDKLYSEPSSLDRLAGNWTDAGNTLTVNPDGTFFEQQSTGCVVNGSYTVIDATHNLYRVSLQVSNCTGSNAGIAFTGLGYLDDSDVNAQRFVQILGGADPANSGAMVLITAAITPQ